MSFTIKKDDQGYYIDIEEFKQYYDIKKIAYYTFEMKEDGKCEFKAYDKKEKLLKPKKKK